MSNSISFTIPLDDYHALTRVSDLLHGMAIDLRTSSDTPIDDINNDGVTDAPTPRPGNQLTTEASEISPVSRPGKAERPATVGTASETEADTVTLPPPNVSTHAQLATLGAIETDSDGLPWDARIHAASKKTLQKTGQWKKRRGVDPQLVADVEAQLRATMAAPVPAAGTIPTPGTVPGTDAAAPAPVDPIDFPQAMRTITDATVAGKIVDVQVQTALNELGIPSLMMLASRPDLIQPLLNKLDI